MGRFHDQSGRTSGPPSGDQTSSIVRSDEIGPNTAARLDDLEVWRPAGDAAVPDTAHGAPWSRFCARQIDMLIWPLVSSATIFMTTPFISTQLADTLQNASSHSLGTMCLTLGVFANALVITVFGNSIGKALFGLRAYPIDPHRKQGFAWNLNREFRVLFFGQAFGMLVIGIITMVMNYKEVTANRPARYDRGFARMDINPIHEGRRRAAMLFTLALYVGVMWLAFVFTEV